MNGQLPALGKNEAQARMLLGNLKPVRGRFLFPRFKAISDLDKGLARDTRVWCTGTEGQCYLDFGNVRNDFRMAAQVVLGKGNAGRVLFPAVYLGKVAKEISRAGFEVVCTDIQEMWVENAGKLGMEAHLLSAEEFPEGKFDLVASFEPYPLYNKPTGLLFIMRAIAETRGIILVSEPMIDSGIPPEPQLMEGHTFNGWMNIFWSYGCIAHELRHDLDYTIFRTTLEAREASSLDLRVASALEGRAAASVARLAEEFGVVPEEMEKSVARIKHALYGFTEYYANIGYVGVLQAHDEEGRVNFLRIATGIEYDSLECLPRDVTYKDFVQEIEVTD